MKVKIQVCLEEFDFARKRENEDDHVKLMGRPNKKVTTGVTEDDPPIVEDHTLKKDPPQDPSSSKASEAKEQRLKELEEQVLRK